MYIIKEKNGKWILIKKGSKRATKTFSSKSSAIAYAEMKGYKYDIAGTKVDNVIRKASKKKPIFITLFVLVLLLAGTFAILWFSGALDPIFKKVDKTSDVSDAKDSESGKNDGSGDAGDNQGSGESGSSGSGENQNTGDDHEEDSLIEENLARANFDSKDFSIHFLEFNNDAAGDSIYIKAGDTDILIDAGSQVSCATYLENQIDAYCTDKKLEYVITTHGDLDHISGMYGNKSGSNYNGILYYYNVGIIIDNKYTNKTTSAYTNYVNARTNAISKGATHYTADQCFNNTDGASSVYELSDKVKMTIIYNKFYFEKTSDENNYSVCTLFTYNDNGHVHNFLLTGDLEEAGEQSIASYYNKSTPEKTLPHCDLFKAGHHGSKTSSNDCLLNLITPDICCICTCCGTNEYTGITANQFPTQAFINRIAKHTDKVYATMTYASYEIAVAEANAKGASKVPGVDVGKEYIKTTGYKKMNGQITVCVGYVDGKFKIGISASTGNLVKLKDTDWMKTVVTIDGKTFPVRTMPSSWT